MKLESKEYYSFLAPSVSHLQTEFLNYIHDNGLDASATINDIENEKFGLIRKVGNLVTCPIDGKKGAAYVHCIEGNDRVGTATHILIYASSYTIGDIIATLSVYCQQRNLDPRNTYIWISGFCTNQHRIIDGDSTSFEEINSIVKYRMRGVGNVIAMMTPWNDPGFLKRVWCLYEIFIADTDEICKMDIAMPPTEQYRLIEAMKTGCDQKINGGMDTLVTALTNIKIENATASVESDKSNILKAIEKEPSYKALNRHVETLMRSWVKQNLVEFLTNEETEFYQRVEENLKRRGELANYTFYIASYFTKLGDHKEAMKFYIKELILVEGFPRDSEDYIIRKATCHATIGSGHFYLGDYSSALDNFEKSWKANEELFGTDHQRTATAIFNSAATKVELGDLDGAVKLFNRCVAIYEKLYGKNHNYTMDAHVYLGKILKRKNEIDVALDKYVMV